MEEIKRRVSPSEVALECDEDIEELATPLLNPSQVVRPSKLVARDGSMLGTNMPSPSQSVVKRSLNETTTTPPLKKVMRATFQFERFRWVKKSAGGEVMDMGRKWFLKLKNCSSHGRRFASVLEEGVYLDFDSDEVFSCPGDLIEKTFMYFVKTDYDAKIESDCLGCDPDIDPISFDYGQHETSCLKHENCKIDQEIINRCLLKIPSVRVLAAARAIALLFKIPENEITLAEVNSYITSLKPETFKKMINLDVEKEAQDELSKW